MRQITTFLAILLLASVSPAGDREDFIGTWINTDPSQGVPRIVIEETNGHWTIQAWGRGVPRDIDWGKTAFHLVSDSSGGKTFKRGFAKWERDFADTYMLIRFEGVASVYYEQDLNGEKHTFRDEVPQIALEKITIFKDGSGRSNYHSLILLHKQRAEQ